jgi:hypothetical protein
MIPLKLPRTRWERKKRRRGIKAVHLSKIKLPFVEHLLSA